MDSSVLLVMSLPGFVSELKWKMLHLLYAFGRVFEEVLLILHKYWVELSSVKSPGSELSLVDNLIHTFTCYWSIHIVYFFLSHFSSLCLSRNLSISFSLSHLLAYSCPLDSLIIFFISVLSPFLFLILVIWLLFLPVSIAKVL